MIYKKRAQSWSRNKRGQYIVTVRYKPTWLGNLLGQKLHDRQYIEGYGEWRTYPEGRSVLPATQVFLYRFLIDQHPHYDPDI